MSAGALDVWPVPRCAEPPAALSSAQSAKLHDEHGRCALLVSMPRMPSAKVYDHLQWQLQEAVCSRSMVALRMFKACEGAVDLELWRAALHSPSGLGEGP